MSDHADVAALFEITMRGYNRGQVEQYVTWLRQELEAIRVAAAELEAAQAAAERRARRAESDAAFLRQELVRLRLAG